jgi:hypothetical protein
MKKVILICLLAITGNAWAQDLPKLSLSVEAVSFQEFAKIIEQKTGYKVFYKGSWVDSVSFSVDMHEKTLAEVMDRVLADTNLNYVIIDGQVFVTGEIQVITTPKLAELLKQDSKAIQTNVEKGLIFEREYQSRDKGKDLSDQLFEIGNRKKMVAGGSATIAGYLKDGEKGDPLPGVLVYSEKPIISTLSDETGFYSITLPLGTHKITYQLFGLQSTQRSVVLFSNGQLNVEMEEEILSLDEVIIESNRDANIENVQMGVSRISVSDSKNVPIVLGERDVMKIATTMAGIQTVGEGAAGFNVRGGKSDQNLIILDDCPIYNTSHFFGFFSVFNSEAIDDMNIYKSSIPTNFGGRLSSVMDISSKSANRDSISGSGGISPITSKLNLELPLFKGSAGLIMSGRATYSNWVLKRVKNSDFNQNRVSFADAMFRYDHDLGAKNKLSLSGYYSEDNFNMSSDTLFSFSDFHYTNKALSAKFMHRFSNDLSGSVSTIYSGYGYDLSYDASPENAFIQDFGISERILKAEAGYSGLAKHEFIGGLEVKNIQVNPGTQSAFGKASIVKDLVIEKEHAFESALYVSDQYSFSDDWSFYMGLRYSAFQRMGAQTVYSYMPSEAKSTETILDSTKYGTGEIIQFYHGLEPRLSVRWKLDNKSSLKAAYNRTRQYVHTLSNSASISPTDIWTLSSTYLKPQISDQFSLGYYRNFPKKAVEASAEVYYKDIQNLLDFKVGANFLLNPQVETVTLQGPGKSYGIEFSIKKNGRLNGWLNYTYARTFIQLDSEHPEERINGGVYYPANYDIPHSLNLVANYKITHRLSASYNFTFKSGRPITYPSGIYDFHNSLSIHYSDRNAFRIPDYTRMDFGLNLEAGHRKGKLAYSYWSFSVYNFLGRANPYSVFFSVDRKGIQGHKLVVFGNPIPTISYNFKF